MVRITGDDELGPLERRARPLAVGQRHERVGRHDPDGLDRAALERLEQLDRGQPRRRRDPPGGDVPVALHRGTVGGVGDLAIAGQQLRQAAGLAPAHRVGLAGERERPAARAADLPAGEAEVDQRAVLQRADRRLVGAHRPQRHRAAGAGEAVGGLLDEPGLDAADRGGARGRPLARDRAGLLPAARVARDERLVDEPVAVDDVQQRAQQREVGARAHRQVQVGALGGRRAARVGADDERALGLTVADAAPEDRVAGGGVRAQQQEAVGERDVGVGRRRAVEAERAAVAGDRRGHAQPRVGVDVVRAEKALGELVDRVVVLGQQLAGDVERDGVGAVLVDDRAQPAGERAEHVLPGARLEARVAVVAVQRHGRAVGRRDGERQAERLAARAPAVGGMRGVAADGGQAAVVIDVGQQAAADATVGALGRGGLHCDVCSVAADRAPVSRGRVAVSTRTLCEPRRTGAQASILHACHEAATRIAAVIWVSLDHGFAERGGVCVGCPEPAVTGGAPAS